MLAFTLQVSILASRDFLRSVASSCQALSLALPAVGSCVCRGLFHLESLPIPVRLVPY